MSGCKMQNCFLFIWANKLEKDVKRKCKDKYANQLKIIIKIVFFIF